MTEKLCKIITLGNKGVGKSTLLVRITYKKFVDLDSTLGVTMYVSKKRQNNQNLTINMWDTASQESFKSINKIYYKSADLVLLVYESISQESFDSLIHWLENFKENLTNKVPIVLVSTKCDLGKVVSSESANEFIRHHNISGFFEVSSKTGEGIDDLFDSICEKLANDFSQRNSIYLQHNIEQKNKCKC